MLILVAVVGLMAVVFAAVAASIRKPNAAAERLHTLSEGQPGTALRRVTEAASDSVLRSTGRGLGRAVVGLLPTSMYRRIDAALQAAGRPVTTPGFVLMAVAVIFVASLFGFSLATSIDGMPPLGRFAVLLVSVGFGFALPAVWLRNRVRARRRAIWRSLPDAADLLTTCVEAGLGVDAAFVRVAGEIDGPLREEFATMLREISLGKPREEAMGDVGRRSQVDELDGLLTAVRQAQESGTSLARVLRAQAHHVRTRRKLTAEEQARLVPARMTFPIVFLTVPTVFVLILGPVVVKIFDVLPV
jgi:tight adherence protein C